MRGGKIPGAGRGGGGCEGEGERNGETIHRDTEVRGFSLGRAGARRTSYLPGVTLVFHHAKASDRQR